MALHNNYQKIDWFYNLHALFIVDRVFENFYEIVKVWHAHLLIIYNGTRIVRQPILII